MKASAPIVPSLGLNAVRLSLLSSAVTAALGAPAMAQESMEIGLFRLFGETGSSMVPWSRSELAREKDAAKFPS